MMADRHSDPSKRVGQLIVACAAWWAMSAIAVPAEADVTFGISGVVLLPNPAATPEGAYAVAQQSDGKLLLGGFCVDNIQGNPQFCIRRLHTNGSADTSFGNAGTGRVALAFSPSHPGETLATMRVQPDGKIVVGGACNIAPPMVQSVDRFCVARLLPNGAPDSAGFGNTGYWSARVMPGTTDSSESIASLLLQADGKIIAVGNCFTDGVPWACHTRLTGAGQVDATYTPTQFTSVNTGSGTNYAALQPDGKWLLAGTCASPQRADLSYDKNMCAVRLNSNGVIDSAFANGNSVARVDEPVGQNAVTTALALDGNGDLILGGTCRPNSISITTQKFCVRKISKDGVVDVAFSAQGASISGTGLNELRAMAVQGDGKIFVTGTCNTNGQNYAFCAARYESDGSNDAGFSHPFVTPLTLAVGATTVNIASAALIQPDGKIVVAGSCDATFASNSTQLCATRLSGGPIHYAQCSGDIDGDGTVSATDSMLLARAALGFRDAALTQGLTFAAHAARHSPVTIRDYLVNQCSMRY